MTETRTKFTAAQALQHLEGVSKKRLYELMNNGALSYEMESSGNSTRRVIDGSELARVFSKKFTPGNPEETKQETVSPMFQKRNETPETALETSLLKQEITFLRDKINAQEMVIKEAREREQDLSKKLDAAQDSLQAQTRLLEDSRNRAPTEKRKGFLATLLGKTG